MSKLICLIGPMGGGKDYRANQFIQDAKVFKHSMKKICFADELREECWQELGWRPENEKEYELFKRNYIESHDGNIGICLTGRQYLQRKGAYRRKKDPNYWVNLWILKVQEQLNNQNNVVCSDLRYPNECKSAFKVSTNIICDPPKKEFIFCCYESDRLDLTNAHESEFLAQQIYKDKYRDGDILTSDYLYSILDIVQKRIDDSKELL
jgi:hypothetical protein